VQLKGAFNRSLARATGYELRRTGGRVKRRKRTAREAGDRLLVAPAFVMCSVRSGSTLLRVLLDSHSRIHSPQELHLRDMAVRVKTDYAAKALGEIGLDDEQLRFMLWDRLLARELAAAGKSMLVNKTPNDVFIADLIARCWPDARFIYLLRHPGAIERSRQETRPQDSPERNARTVLRYGNAIEEARAARPGLTIRYEELTTDPRATTRRVCAFLEVPWEAAMLDYGRFDHGRMKPGLGDWKSKIKSGEVQAAEPPPPLDEIHPSLHELCAAWGYAPAPAVQPAS
jgi:Sulfotransferase family